MDLGYHIRLEHTDIFWGLRKMSKSDDSGETSLSLKLSPPPPYLTMQPGLVTYN